MNADVMNANLFMMCSALNEAATADFPPGFIVRHIRPNELDIWKRMPFDDANTADEHYDYMNKYFDRVYAPRINDFYNSCLFVCDEKDHPVGTCFIWQAHGIFSSIHWYKVIQSHEGMGIGRALLTSVMRHAEYPVYLHTHPGCLRAVKLYSDVGFSLLLDPVIGNRNNDLEIGLPYLKEHMPKSEYDNLRFEHAPESFLELLTGYDWDEF